MIILLQETFVTTDEFGHDLEHVEVLQRKFDEFQKDMASQEYRVTEVNDLADKLVTDGHPEKETITQRKEELNEAWARLKQLALMRQEKLFGAHEIQRFNRDADETVAWIAEKVVINFKFVSFCCSFQGLIIFMCNFSCF